MDFVTPMASKLINENTSMQLRCIPTLYLNGMMDMTCSGSRCLHLRPSADCQHLVLRSIAGYNADVRVPVSLVLPTICTSMLYAPLPAGDLATQSTSIAIYRHHFSTRRLKAGSFPLSLRASH